MANLNTILSDIGTGLKKFFGVSVTVATDAEPFVDALFPGTSTVYNLVVGEIGKAEAASVAAGSQSGTGVQKLAAVLQATSGQVAEIAQENGWSTPTEEQLTDYINAIVKSLNTFTKAPAAV